MSFKEGFWDVDDAGYYGDRECVSNSNLGVFGKSVPTYHATFVTGEIASPGGSEAMEFGRAFHVALLEPEKLDESIAIAPEVDRRTKDGKAAWEAFLIASHGKIPLTERDARQIVRMRCAVMGNPMAAALLRRKGRTEQAIRWVDTATGIKCRAKIDKLTQDGLVIDLKTTQDICPSEFGKSAFNYGYDRQAAFYLKGAWRLRELGLIEGKPEDGNGYPFFFIAVSKSVVPECVVFQPTARMIETGGDSIDRDMRRLRDCLDFNVWESETHGKVVPLDLPPWGRR